MQKRFQQGLLAWSRRCRPWHPIGQLPSAWAGQSGLLLAIGVGGLFTPRFAFSSGVPSAKRVLRPTSSAASPGSVGVKGVSIRTTETRLMLSSARISGSRGLLRSAPQSMLNFGRSPFTTSTFDFGPDFFGFFLGAKKQTPRSSHLLQHSRRLRALRRRRDGAG